MMEDKENTRPREKKVVEIRCDDSEKLEKPNKEKKETMTKVASGGLVAQATGVRSFPCGTDWSPLSNMLEKSLGAVI